MNYKQMLKRINAEIAKEQLTEKVATLYLRARDGEAWNKTLVSLLMGASEMKSPAAWELDASKFFFVDRGEVKYLWRLVFRGDVISALGFLGNCILGVTNANVKELDSFPLSEGSNTSPTLHAEN